MSVEKDVYAHRTLRLRAYYRWFRYRNLPIPAEYYEYIAGDIGCEVLSEAYPTAWKAAENEAMLAMLGNPESQPEIDRRIKEILGGQKNWILIGGPPCQAYSLVGRARRRGMAEDAETKERNVLYQQYLRVICHHAPAVFVMENVKGILSSKVNNEPIFPRILKDLENPRASGRSIGVVTTHNHQYHILSFVTGRTPEDHRDYLIRSENYGVPQCRHRVILLGVREDVYRRMREGEFLLDKNRHGKVTVRHVIGGTPPLRSGFSKGGNDSASRWSRFFRNQLSNGFIESLPPELRLKMYDHLLELSAGNLNRRQGGKRGRKTTRHPEWYQDKNLRELPNHETRGHMESDLLRYLFVSAYGVENKASPRLADFPKRLLPDHKNAKDGRIANTFADRFKVQRWDEPSSTVTCHISKDGHYFIHPDPTQCRSLTVREAARLQTFPDNYFFEGGRTQQYHQVGNAVPPFLASQLAEVVYGILDKAGI